MSTSNQGSLSEKLVYWWYEYWTNTQVHAKQHDQLSHLGRTVGRTGTASAVAPHEHPSVWRRSPARVWSLQGERRGVRSERETCDSFFSLLFPSLLVALCTGCRWAALNATDLCPKFTAYGRCRAWVASGGFWTCDRSALNRSINWRALIGSGWGWTGRWPRRRKKPAPIRPTAGKRASNGCCWPRGIRRSHVKRASVCGAERFPADNDGSIGFAASWYAGRKSVSSILPSSTSPCGLIALRAAWLFG